MVAGRLPGSLPPSASEIVLTGSVSRVVLAPNRSWEPGWKRIKISTSSLALKPDQLVDRIHAALPAGDLREMRELVLGTLAMCPATPEVVRARSQVDRLLEVLP